MLNDFLNRIIEKKFTLIAEIGVNYYDFAKKLNISLMQAAKLMILEAKNAGVHAVKFQSYKAESLASKNSPSYWDISEESETSQYLLFKKYDSFGGKEYHELAEYCHTVGIEFLSTAFDIDAVDYLENIVNIYKISSSDLNNFPFVEYQARKKKPMIISAGASNMDEIQQAVELIRNYNDQPIVLMHCVLEYPTPYEHTNLRKITTLKNRYPDLYIGYSDHSKPDTYYDVIKTAYLLGANVIEKHFTLDKCLKGNDHYHAMDVHDAINIIGSINNLEKILGSGDIRCLESEKIARLNARRSLVANMDIIKGEKVTSEMLTYKRPGTGISVSEIADIIGRTAMCDIEKDMVLQYSMFE